MFRGDVIVFCVVDGRAVREMLPLLVRFETAKLHAARNFSFSFHTVPFFNIDHITRTR